jgi:threonine dehydrogenase-like Zn-dependent dehydrogenase
VAAAVGAVGTASTRAACIAATRSAGVVVLSGLHEERSAMPVEDVIWRGLRVFGSFRYTQRDFADAVDGLACRRLRLDPWVVEAPLGAGGAWMR